MRTLVLSRVIQSDQMNIPVLRDKADPEIYPAFAEKIFSRLLLTTPGVVVASIHRTATPFFFFYVLLRKQKCIGLGFPPVSLRKTT